MKFLKAQKTIYVLTLASLALNTHSARSPEPTAIAVPVRTDWLGYDGVWSPVSVRVGTPPQWVDLFVSTASQETWVIGPGGCDGTAQCLTERGGIFQSNKSSTWQEQGAFSLNLDSQLGFDGNGIYGFDSIALSNQISVPSQVIGVINTTEYWLGIFGLGVEPTNFTSADKPTFLDSMVENRSLIPSHSYGYTAGAHYRLKSVPASLVLGGYDANRFEPHEISFELDDSRSPVVALEEVSVTAKPLPTSEISTGWLNNSFTLLGPSGSDLFMIDSSTPFLWFPEQVCLQFEKALGLTYDDDLQLYTFGANNSQHNTLANWNLSFQFVVADLPGSSNSISLTLPYAAFDLQLSYPYPGLNATENSPPTSYFPLRKAANSSQYTIGRSFLQETYLKVDYERNNFSVHQAIFSSNALEDTNLIDISRPKNSTFGGPRSVETPLMSKSEIAGLAVGATISLILLVIIYLLCLRIYRDRKHNAYIRKEDNDLHKKSSLASRFARWLFGLPKTNPINELDERRRDAFEVPNDKEIMELPTKTLDSELDGSNPDSPASENTYHEHGANAVYAIGHDPEQPVELPYRSSLPVPDQARKAPKTRLDHPPVFAPSTHIDWRTLSRQNTHTTADVSSPTDTASKRSSKESSPTFIVSPITPRQISPEFSSLSTAARSGAWYVSRGGHAQGGSKAGQSPHSGHGHSLSEVSASSDVSTITTRIRHSVIRGFNINSEHPVRQGHP